MLLPVSSHRAREVNWDCRRSAPLPSKQSPGPSIRGYFHTCCSLCLEYLPTPRELLSSEWGGVFPWPLDCFFSSRSAR